MFEAVGRIIGESGVEGVRINAVAREAAVSKMLIYRYYGNLDGLVEHFVTERDYWVNVPARVPSRTELNSFVKDIFHRQIESLRNDRLTRQLARWELTADSEVIRKLREKREENALRLVETVSRVGGLPPEQVRLMATLITTSVSYLAIFATNGTVYNGFEVGRPEGWDELEQGINSIIDRMIPAQKKIVLFR
ncbi:MAG: TetR/AcrR family transcriptional regulator [Alistipes sp.]|nr:TetR/AcrR family transcriptional regulator [Alistipes sp.]